MGREEKELQELEETLPELSAAGKEYIAILKTDKLQLWRENKKLKAALREAAEIVAKNYCPADYDCRLDELLAEIEKRGWQIELVKYARWRITIWKIQWRKQGLFIGETPGEVAAKALIWLLKQNESTNVSCTETLG